MIQFEPKGGGLERERSAGSVTRTFRPLTGEEAGSLLAKTFDASQTGKYELFKTSKVFDSTAKHPEFLS